MKSNQFALLIVGVLTLWLAARALTLNSGFNGESEDSAAVQLTSENFHATLASTSQPVMVDFWASWCGPCRKLAPTVEQLARDMEGRAIIAKLNVDQARDIAATYGVQSIPTLIIFKDSREVNRLVGLTTQDRLELALQAAGANQAPPAPQTP
jgi:thioredoxin 1